MCGCRCCVSSSDSCQNTFLVLRLYLKSSIPLESPVRKGREVHEAVGSLDFLELKELYFEGNFETAYKVLQPVANELLGFCVGHVEDDFVIGEKYQPILIECFAELFLNGLVETAHKIFFITLLPFWIAVAENDLANVFAFGDVFAVGEFFDEIFPGLCATKNPVVVEYSFAVLFQCIEIGMLHVDAYKCFS